MQTTQEAKDDQYDNFDRLIQRMRTCNKDMVGEHAIAIRAAQDESTQQQEEIAELRLVIEDDQAERDELVKEQHLELCRKADECIKLRSEKNAIACSARRGDARQARELKTAKTLNRTILDKMKQQIAALDAELANQTVANTDQSLLVEKVDEEIVSIQQRVSAATKDQRDVDTRLASIAARRRVTVTPTHALIVSVDIAPTRRSRPGEESTFMRLGARILSKLGRVGSLAGKESVKLLKDDCAGMLEKGDNDHEADPVALADEPGDE